MLNVFFHEYQSMFASGNCSSLVGSMLEQVYRQNMIPIDYGIFYHNMST